MAEYVVVDIRWYVENDKAHGYNEKRMRYSPWMSTAGYLPASTGFLLHADGKGFRLLPINVINK